MIILPINSVINPFLYDGAITNAITASLRSMSTKISNSTIGNYLTTLATSWRQYLTRVSNSILLQAARVSNSVLLQAARDRFNPLPTEDIVDEQQETNV